MIHRIILFLKFATSSEDLIEPLWNGKSNITSVDGQTLQSLRI